MADLNRLRRSDTGSRPAQALAGCFVTYSYKLIHASDMYRTRNYQILCSHPAGNSKVRQSPILPWYPFCEEQLGTYITRHCGTTTASTHLQSFSGRRCDL